MKNTDGSEVKHPLKILDDEQLVDLLFKISSFEFEVGNKIAAEIIHEAAKRLKKSN